MSKNKHLSLDDRCKIQLMLDNKGSFSSIATQLEKDPTTIQRRSAIIFSIRKQALTGVLTTAVPNVLPVRNPISVLNVTLSDGILYADDVPCAMLSARISKKKPVNVF